MRGLIIVVALALVAGCTFEASCGGKKTLNMDKGRELITKMFEGEGVTPDNIECPNEVPLKKGHTVNCKVTLGQVTVTVAVVQDNDEGDVTMNILDGLVFQHKAETVLVQKLKEATGVEGKATCPGPVVKKAVVGDKFVCKATAPNGDVVEFEFTVTDETGSVHLEPLAKPAPPAD